jgi:hypothetical protein
MNIAICIVFIVQAPDANYFMSIFMQLGFNLSNGVTDALESSTILIYSEEHKSFYTRYLGRMPSD